MIEAQQTSQTQEVLQGQQIIHDPQVVQTVDQLTAIIPLVIPRSEIRTMIGPALGELIASAEAQGLVKTGPWFAHHLSFSESHFDFEVSIPVSAPFNAVGRAIPGLWPAGKVARATYRGDYAHLVPAWDAFRHWIDSQGHKRAPHIYEVYTVTPPTAKSPADCLTALNWPLLA